MTRCCCCRCCWRRRWSVPLCCLPACLRRTRCRCVRPGAQPPARAGCSTARADSDGRRRPEGRVASTAAPPASHHHPRSGCPPVPPAAPSQATQRPAAARRWGALPVTLHQACSGLTHPAALPPPHLPVGWRSIRRVREPGARRCSHVPSVAIFAWPPAANCHRSPGH